MHDHDLGSLLLLTCHPAFCLVSFPFLIWQSNLIARAWCSCHTVSLPLADLPEHDNWTDVIAKHDWCCFAPFALVASWVENTADQKEPRNAPGGTFFGWFALCSSVLLFFFLSLSAVWPGYPNCNLKLLKRQNAHLRAKQFLVRLLFGSLRWVSI